MTPLVLGRSAVLAEVLRFGAVGGGATVLYGIASFALAAAGLPAVLASVVAYALSTAFAYLGHRTFTFGSRGDPSEEAPRFLVLNALGLALALALPAAATGVLHVDGRLGFLAACLAIPICNYFALKRLVFRGAAIVARSSGL